MHHACVFFVLFLLLFIVLTVRLCLDECPPGSSRGSILYAEIMITYIQRAEFQPWRMRGRHDVRVLRYISSPALFTSAWYAGI